MGEVIDGVFEVINSEQLETLIEENNRLLDSIEFNTARSWGYLEEINESMNNIEAILGTGFMLVCLALTAVIIIKTFFTGW